MIDKTKAFEALKADYADNPLVSERTIKETLENLTAIVKDDIEEDKFLNTQVPAKTTEGQARKSSSDAVKKVEAERKPTLNPQAKERNTTRRQEGRKPAWLGRTDV